MIVMAGEIWGETSSLALFEVSGDELLLLRTAHIANGEYSALPAVVRRFAAEDLRRMRAACFVVGEEPPWPVESAPLTAAMRMAIEVVRDARDADTSLWSAARRAAYLAV